MKRHSGGLFLVIAAVLFFGATPAMAATRTIEWTTPTIADPVLRQDGKIAVMTYNDDGRSTDKIEISIENPPASEDPCRPNPVTASVRPPDGTRGAVPFETPISFPCNGSYSVVASAWNTRQGLDDADKWSSVLPIKVAIAPMPVQLSRDGWIKGDDSGPAYIDLRWNPNNEIDLIGYRIDRSINNQSLETLVEIPAGEPTKYRDSGLEVASGTYTYKVVAIRKGATESERVESLPVSISVEAGAESGPISGTPEVPPPTTPPAPTQPPTPSLEKTYTPSSSSGESSGKSSGIKTEDNSKASGGFSKTVQLPEQNSDQLDPATSTPTTIDTGYEDRLPFASDGSGATQGSGEALLEELGAGEETAKRRAIMVPIASSLILVVGWMFARLIHREMSKADSLDGSAVVVSTAPWSIAPNSLAPNSDDTGPILTRSELQAVRRNKQRVSSSKRQI